MRHQVRRQHPSASSASAGNSDVRPGDDLALINSFGVLEVARAERSAAEGLGVARGAPVTVVSK